MQQHLSASSSKIGQDIEYAVERLHQGQLIGLPTETVYGLAADATNPLACQKIFTAKQRPTDHPLIVHLADISWMELWAKDIPPAAYQLAQAFWPGPMTLILPRRQHVDNLITGGQDSVGLRIPNHPLALQLLKTFGKGVAAPSANRFGRISPTTAQDVIKELGTHVDYVLDGGACQIGIESTIIDLSRFEQCGTTILRPGAILPQHVSQILGQTTKTYHPLSDIPHSNVPRVSGSLSAHYAPTTPLHVFQAQQLIEFITEHLPNKKIGLLLYTHDLYEKLNKSCRDSILLSHHTEQYTHHFYRAIRQLDEKNLDLILVEALPNVPEWMPVNDRLQRAAKGAGLKSE